jgi:signal transduction histidine kinase
VALGAFLCMYLSWQLFDWIPGSRVDVGDLLILPVDVAAVLGAWWGSRCFDRSDRLRSFWRLMAAAFVAETIGDLVQAVYDLLLHSSPFPSLADPFYLAFYLLLVLALRRVPLPALSAGERRKTMLDAATIVVGGGAVIWYFVLGPTALEGGQSPLAMIVSIAFPIGDLLLLAGLAVLVLRQSPVRVRRSLALVALALALGIVADVLYGDGQLHGTYAVGNAADLLYVLEFSTFAMAGICQVRERREHRDERDRWPTVSAGAPMRRSRASWLPYLSVATGLGVLLSVELGGSFFPDVSLVLIVIVLTMLVSARQYFAQRELVQVQDALRRSEQVKDEFLSVVGHELRTPLASIRGSLGLLRGGVLGRLPTDAENMVSVALLNSERLGRLVNDILDIERMAAGRLTVEPSRIAARALIEQAVQVVQATADEAGVTLRLEAADIEVLADSDRIVQALVNLLGNAVKFSDRGGVVTVLVSRSGSEALFSVHDDGRGIPPDRLEAIFERFRQVDASDARERGGTGLGLPIARGIVEQHGGHMWAESFPGSGSTLRFTLPLAARDGTGDRVRSAESGASA